MRLPGCRGTYQIKKARWGLPDGDGGDSLLARPPDGRPHLPIPLPPKKRDEASGQAQKKRVSQGVEK